jgi:hypothetical protein
MTPDKSFGAVTKEAAVHSLAYYQRQWLQVARESQRWLAEGPARENLLALIQQIDQQLASVAVIVKEAPGRR